MIVIIPVALVILLLIWGVVAYNRLIAERLKIQTQWSQIDVALKQRFDLILNLVETTKGYTAHEKEALQAATNTRSRYLSTGDTQGQMRVSTELSDTTSRLVMATGYYPELETNQSFLHLQQRTSAMKEKLAGYRQFHNNTVLRYNSLLITVLADLIAKLFHLRKEGFFKAEEAEKTVIAVKS